jgi:hypothetical protein
MICPVDRRIQDAREVVRELEKIEDWEKNAQLVPMSANALSSLEQLTRRSLESGRITAENKQAREQEIQTLASVQQSVADWLTVELSKVASMVSSDTIKCEVQPAALLENLKAATGTNSRYLPLNGVELTFDDVNDPSNREHVLKFYLCRHARAVVTFHTSGGNPHAQPLQPARDAELAILPVYSFDLKHHRAAKPSVGYLSRKDQIGKGRSRLFLSSPKAARNSHPQLEHYRVDRIAWTFESEVALHIGFRASEWPGNEEQLREILNESIEIFFAHLNSS